MNTATLIQTFYDYVDDQMADYWGRDKVLRFINRGQEEVFRSIEDGDDNYFTKCIEFAVTINNPGELVFTLPVDFKRVIIAERLVTDGTPIPVKWLDFNQRHNVAMWPSIVIRGRVRPHCYLTGSLLGVINPPEAYTLRVWYANVIPELDSDDDVPENIPADFHELIALEAAKRAMATEGRPFAFNDIYERQAASVQIMTKQRQRQEPRTVHFVQD